MQRQNGFSPQHHIRQNFRSNHGAGHSPEIEPGGNVDIRNAAAVFSNIRHAVQAYAILICPGDFLPGFRKVAPGKGARHIKAAPAFTRAVVAAAYEQKTVVVSKIHAVFSRILYGTAQIRRVFQRDDEGTLLVKLGKVQPVAVKEGVVCGDDYLFRTDGTALGNSGCSAQL